MSNYIVYVMPTMINKFQDENDDENSQLSS